MGSHWIAGHHLFWEHMWGNYGHVITYQVLILKK